MTVMVETAVGTRRRLLARVLWCIGVGPAWAVCTVAAAPFFLLALLVLNPSRFFYRLYWATLAIAMLVAFRWPGIDEWAGLA